MDGIGIAVVVAFAVLFLLAIIIGIWMIGVYNGLVTLRNAFKNAFAQIDTTLKRRYDLIPNLVSSAKGYMTHERETLESVIQARNHAAGLLEQVERDTGNGEAVAQLFKAETAVKGAVGRLFAVAENYPQLKADAHISKLMDELSDTENRIMYARQAYNDAVTAYNTAREVFPAVMIAGWFGMTPASLFEVDAAAERQAPKVEF